MTAIGVVLSVAAGLALVAVGWAGSRTGQLPSGHPAELLGAEVLLDLIEPCARDARFPRSTP